MSAETCTDTLVKQHQAGLRRYVLFLGCDAATADDLVQEAFLALISVDFDDRDRRATAAWLRKKARFLFLEQLRRARRRREVRFADVADEVWAELEGDDEGETYRRALRECLRTLSPRSRHAVELRYAERAGRSEMARRLGLKKNGVKTLLQRVRAALRECVRERIRR